MFQSNIPSPVVSNKKYKDEEIIYAKGDSAASHHYWREEDKQVLEKIEKHSGPSVLLPNNNTISVTSRGQLPLSEQLSSRARNAMILPGLKSASLISIGQLCDDGCNVLLNNKKLLAIKNNQLFSREIGITPTDYGTYPFIRHPFPAKTMTSQIFIRAFIHQEHQLYVIV